MKSLFSRFRILGLLLTATFLVASCGNLVTSTNKNPPPPKTKSTLKTKVGKTDYTSWSVGNVNLQAPKWQGSEIATTGLNLLVTATHNLVLEQDINDWITVEVGPPQPNQETQQLNNFVNNFNGAITSGPLVIPGGQGVSIDEYFVTFSSPTSNNENAIIGYWYNKSATVAVNCSWNATNTGLGIQDACHKIFSTLSAS